MKRQRMVLLLKRLESGDWKIRDSSISGGAADTDTREFMLCNRRADFYWIDVDNTTFRAWPGSVSMIGAVYLAGIRKEIRHKPNSKLSQRVLSMLKEQAATVRSNRPRATGRK